MSPACASWNQYKDFEALGKELNDLRSWQDLIEKE